MRRSQAIGLLSLIKAKAFRALRKWRSNETVLCCGETVSSYAETAPVHDAHRRHFSISSQAKCDFYFLRGLAAADAGSKPFATVRRLESHLSYTRN